MVHTAKESIGTSATSLEIYGKMQEVFIEMDSEQDVSILTYLYTSSTTKPSNLGV
jgi:hypothetical protein